MGGIKAPAWDLTPSVIRPPQDKPSVITATVPIAAPNSREAFSGAPCFAVLPSPYASMRTLFSSIRCLPHRLQFLVATLTKPGCRVLWAADLTGDITMANGTVKWFNTAKGFGFIAPEGGRKDVFVHISSVERAGLTGLSDNQAVTFDIVSGRDGRESAENLQLA